MKKFLLALLMAGLMGLTACGSNTSGPAPESSGGAGNSSVSESPGSASLEEPAPEPTEEPEPTPAPEPEMGRLVKMTAYGPHGEICYWHDFTYGPDGKRESVTSYSADGTETGRVDYAYDEDGKALVGYKSSSAVPYWDSDGNMKSPSEIDPMVGRVEATAAASSGRAENSYYDNGNIKMEYQYDGDRQTGWKHYYSSGELMEYAVYEYDQEGEHSRSCYYMPDGTLRRTIDYERSENKSTATTIEYSENGERLVSQEETEYNSNNSPARRTMLLYEGSVNTADGPLEINDYTEETYNSDGQILVREKTIIKNGESFVFERQEYTYE